MSRIKNIFALGTKFEGCFGENVLFGEMPTPACVPELYRWQDSLDVCGAVIKIWNFLSNLILPFSNSIFVFSYFLFRDKKVRKVLLDLLECEDIRYDDEIW